MELMFKVSVPCQKYCYVTPSPPLQRKSGLRILGCTPVVLKDCSWLCIQIIPGNISKEDSRIEWISHIARYIARQGSLYYHSGPQIKNSYV